MEVLFDPAERGDARSDEPASGEHRTGGSGLEVELDTTPARAANLRSPQTPDPTGPAPKDLSVDNLLKRFGIK
jgi:hypothetical protein